jgi:hypothetical protein
MKHLQKFESFDTNDRVNIDKVEKCLGLLRRIESGEAENSILRMTLKSDSKVSEIELHNVYHNRHDIEIGFGTKKKFNWQINKVFATLDLPGGFRDLQPLKDKEILLIFNAVPSHTSNDFYMRVKISFGSVRLFYDVLDMSLIDDEVME